jgi:hypothetical protein
LIAPRLAPLPIPCRHSAALALAARDAVSAADTLNARPFQKLEGCRRSAFESIDRPAMKPLPSTRFQIAEWKKARVNIDYHVDYDRRLYSVPNALVGERVWVRATSTVVEIFFRGQRVFSHQRSYAPPGTAVNCPEHRPKSHREYGEWPPSAS